MVLLCWGVGWALDFSFKNPQLYTFQYFLYQTRLVITCHKTTDLERTFLPWTIFINILETLRLLLTFLSIVKRSWDLNEKHSLSLGTWGKTTDIKQISGCGLRTCETKGPHPREGNPSSDCFYCLGESEARTWDLKKRVGGSVRGVSKTRGRAVAS